MNYKKSYPKWLVLILVSQWRLWGSMEQSWFTYSMWLPPCSVKCLVNPSGQQKCQQYKSDRLMARSPNEGGCTLLYLSFFIIRFIRCISRRCRISFLWTRLLFLRLFPIFLFGFRLLFFLTLFNFFVLFLSFLCYCLLFCCLITTGH